MRRTKIVCTIGPASESLDVLVDMIDAGMDVARFNLSHGSLEDHKRRIENVRKAAMQCGKPAAIMMDTKGPEIRLGVFQTGSVLLRDGDLFELWTEPVTGDSRRVQVSYAEICQDVSIGNHVLLDDGNIDLEVLNVEDNRVLCRVINGGTISDRKKVNLPGIPVSLPSVSDQDAKDIRFSVEIGADFIAASFVRRAEDVLQVRQLVKESGGNAQIIAKIESRQGLDNLDDILEASDGLMVARGDLGVEIPLDEVPLVQKRMIQKARLHGKPVITATQMLESMVARPRPTRAEASDVANAIFDGSDAVMLSAETAAGKYPVEAVNVMDRIARTNEKALTWGQSTRCESGPSLAVTDAIGHATWAAARDLGAAAIITPTESGYTARMVAKYRPLCPIIAVTPHERVWKGLALVWGVYPLTAPGTSNTDEMIARAVDIARGTGLIRKRDLVVITAGVPSGISGTTNLLKIHTV